MTGDFRMVEISEKYKQEGNVLPIANCLLCSKRYSKLNQKLKY
jgi:hypothetical protein